MLPANTQSLQTVIKFTYKKRSPFSGPRISVWARPYQMAYHPYVNSKVIMFGKALSKPVNIIWKSLLKIGTNTKGQFAFTDQHNKKHIIKFRTGNTQFQSIYSYEHADGYETEVAALIDMLAHDTSVFYDIGSNWGHHSLFLASKPNFNGKIYAFEPVPDTYRDLCSVVSQSGLSERIQCLNIGLSNRKTIKHIAFPDHISSGLAKLSERGRGPRIAVQALDDLQLPDPDVIKLDTEGEEANVLRGGIDLLKRAKPMVIFESFPADVQNPMHVLERFKVLEELGYSFFQPGYFLSQDGIQYAANTQNGSINGSDIVLALYEFKAEERFLLSGNNFLACHRERVEELMSRAALYNNSKN